MRQIFVAPDDLEGWMDMVTIRWDWQMDVKVSAVRMRFNTKRGIWRST